MNTNDLLKIQHLYNEKYWLHFDSDIEYVRHVTLHIAKLLGKLATYCEAIEDGRDASLDAIRNEVTPDLLVWALTLTDRFEFDLEEVYQKRLEQNIEKKHS